MTPEARLALWAVGLAALGLAFLITALITAGHHHKEEQ